MSNVVGTQIAASWYAKDQWGAAKTGLTASDFTLELFYKEADETVFTSGVETITVAELDSTNLAGLYEVRFTPQNAGDYVLQVTPGYSTTQDSKRYVYDVAATGGASLTDTLCTVAQVKTYIGETKSTHDTLLSGIVEYVTEFIQSYTHKDFFEQTYTEYPTGGGSKLVLGNAPVSSITSIHESLDVPRSYTSSTLLTADTHYIADLDDGIVHRLNSKWSKQPKAIRAIYTAGYGSTDIPKDVQWAAVLLSVLAFNQRRDVGAAGASVGGESVDFENPHSLPEIISDILNFYSDGGSRYFA